MLYCVKQIVLYHIETHSMKAIARPNETAAVNDAESRWPNV